MRSVFAILRQSGWHRVALLLLLCAVSFYVFSLQLLWYYHRPFALPAYYGIFFLLILGSIWMYFVAASRRVRILFVMIAALAIGMIPYEMRLALLFSPERIDAGRLSDATKNLSLPSRVLVEAAFFPAIHAILQFLICVLVSGARTRRQLLKHD
jgi:hypothetical protein